MPDRDSARRRARRLRASLNRRIAGAAPTAGLGHYLVLDYPPAASLARTTRLRGRLHDLIAGGEPAYRAALHELAALEADLARIPRRSADERSPSWLNEFVPGLDSASIYGFLRSRAPATYLEVGSGESTRFARRAIGDGGLATRIVSIDPRPRRGVDALCDKVVREPLELADRSLFASLTAGDVIFVDGSHRVFTGSDATVFVLDILPALAPGVLVGIHDVYLPDDYPAEIAGRHYSEQYLLGALLLGEPDWLRIVLAADYVGRRRELSGELGGLWGRPHLQGVETHGVALWVETRDPTGGGPARD